MVSEKIKRKELKQLDLFQKKAIELFHIAVNYKNAILGTVFSLLVLSMIGIGYKFFVDRALEKKLDTLAGYNEIFDKEQKKLFDSQEGLRNELAAYEQEFGFRRMRESGRGGRKIKKEEIESLAKFADLNDEQLQEKLEGSYKKIASMHADHSESLKLYQGFYKENQATPVGRRAALAAARILVEQKNYKEAAEIVAQVLEKAGPEKFFQVHLRFYYIGLLEDLEEFDKAISQTQIVEEKAEDEVKPKAILARGKILLMQEKTEEAFVQFDDIINRYNDSKEAQWAQAYKKVFGGGS